jgi:CDP-glucose 4,6-dehydratase
MKLTDFYCRQRVLITGHTGFKGTWLARWLELLGADVTGFSLPAERAPCATGSGRSVFGDIRDLTAVQTALADAAPTIVFHLAAQALVRRSYREPIATFATNVMGTAHVLEAARQTPSVRAVVVVTSDKCYANREWCWGYREDDPLGGHDPYSSSKGCAELVTAAYRQSFIGRSGRLAIASARAGNVIGGGDWAEDRIIPDIVRAVTSGKPVVLRRPHAVRPWQHVLDPLHGYLILGQRLATGGPEWAEGWNFGPAELQPLSVRALVERFLAIWGQGELVVQDDGTHPHEAGMLRLDCSKAHSRLGWLPLLPVDDALRWTAEWYRAHAADPQGAAALTDQQIQQFMERAAAAGPISGRKAA